MATDVIMPQMGESIAEGTITRWMKKVGDTVKRDEPIFEISTDKVDAEIPSPAAGTLLEIKVPEGQTVAINTVVARIGEAGEQPAAAAPPPAAADATGTVRPPEKAETPVEKPDEKPAPAPAPGAAPPPRQPAPASAAPAAAAPSPAPAPQEGARVESIEERIRRRSSPLVRKIAGEHSVDITQ